MVFLFFLLNFFCEFVLGKKRSRGNAFPWHGQNSAFPTPALSGSGSRV